MGKQTISIQKSDFDGIRLQRLIGQAWMIFIKGLDEVSSGLEKGSVYGLLRVIAFWFHFR